MDTTKVTAALTLARTELRNAVQAQRNVVADPKAQVKDIAAAAKSLKSAGSIDTALARAETKIAGIVSRLNGSGKKREKKAKAAKA